MSGVKRRAVRIILPQKLRTLEGLDFVAELCRIAVRIYLQKPSTPSFVRTLLTVGMKEGKVVTKSAEDGVARSRGKHEPTHLDLVHRLLPGFSPKFTSDSFFKGVSELLREAVQGYLRQLADPDETIKEVVRRAGNAATLMANLAGVSLEMLQNTDDIIISTRKGAIKISSEKVACLVQERSDELDAPRGGHGGGWSTGMGTYWDLKRLIPFRKEVWRALQKAVKSSKSPTGWRISVAHLVAFIVEDMLENVVGGPANRSSARK